MSEQTQPSASPSKGLAEIVWQQIEATLMELVPLWQNEPPVDWQRVVRPTGEGSSSINIEPYRGLHSRISFRKKIDGRASLRLLDEIIRANQPAVLGYVSGGPQQVQDVLSLTIFWCQAALRYIDTHLSVEDAIKRVLIELDHILETSYATHEVLTPLSGLKLPEGIEQIELGPNVFLRRLRVDEISDLGSNNILSESRYDISSSFVTTALVITREIRFILSERYEEPASDFTLLQETRDQIDAVLCSLYVLKTGRVGVVASFTTLRPTVFPNMSGYSSAPLMVNPFGSLELTREEISLFIERYQKMISNKRDEVRIAAARLLDAENRLSPVDSLLDAVIGLEVLLNPNDYAELSFRVALNYAYLGSSADRRKRYESVRDIQKTRNRVVHGGLNLRLRDSTIIHEHAALAKECLRDSVTHFLIDEAFTGNKKLDVEFWLDRVIPPNL
jgi:Apea-like HEPN